MNHDSRIGTAGATGSSPPSEAWLFAQALLGNSVPSPRADQAEAHAERERLEWLASISDRHADELSRLKSAEAEARRQRAQLEWLAGISTRHEDELRRVQAAEAQARQAAARHERFISESRLREAEWHEGDHPRQPKGVPTGGQWVSKGGTGTNASSPLDSAYQSTPDSADGHERSATSRYVRDFEVNHNLTLRDTLKLGKLSAGQIVRIKFSDEEIKQILKSAQKSGSELNTAFYTAANLPARLRAAAERDFASLSGDEKYAAQAFVSNQRRARVILLFRNPSFQQYVGQLYGFLRSLTPAHFMIEKGVVVATGKEPVLGGAASRLNALKDMLIYLAVMKGVSWGTNKIVGIAAGPEAAGDITITFEGGGKLVIRRGADYNPESLANGVERAAAGKSVEINPPAPKPPQPKVTDVPRVTDDPKAFRRWFNELSAEDLNVAWKSANLRNAIAKGLRWPGGQHEWLMIARTPKFKEWGLTAEQMAEMRTPISKVRFKNPDGGHKGEGSTRTHNQILKIIDSSPDFATFKTRLQKWANERLEGGADALPPELRP